jgi:hypothetical protein
MEHPGSATPSFRHPGKRDRESGLIDAQCAVCGLEWQLSIEERALMARALGVDQRVWRITLAGRVSLRCSPRIFINARQTCRATSAYA